MPITVRQLEAVARVAEALAKLALAPVATERHVAEALRLFLASTMDAVAQGAAASGEPGAGVRGGGQNAVVVEAARVEEELRRRLPIGWSTSLATLRREFVEGRGYGEGAVARALLVLQRREVLQMRSAGSVVCRVGV